MIGKLSFLPQHEGLVHRISEMESVITDSQVVLQSKRLQHYPISYREGQTQVIAGVTLNGKQTIELERETWVIITSTSTYPHTGSTG